MLPGLEGGEYAVTSPQTTDYNCVAWVLEDTERWWTPVRAVGSYWPTGAPRSLRVADFVAMFRMQGFETCDQEPPQAGYEQIALFAKDGLFTHVARQLPNGRWTSKLGADVDIEHELEDLIRRRSPSASYRYGEVVGYMKRPQPSS